MKYDIVVIAGPSGSGKNSVREGVLEKCDDCVKLVTACTRPMRQGEVEGVDYFFMTNEKFESLIESGGILEYNADQARETGTYRGMLKEELDKQIATGKTVMAQIQLQGLEYLRDHYRVCGIFIQPESVEDLINRITERADLSQNELEARLEIARDEIENQSKFYDYQITNKDGALEDAVDEVISIITTVEKTETEQQQ